MTSARKYSTIILLADTHSQWVQRNAGDHHDGKMIRKAQHDLPDTRFSVKQHKMNSRGISVATLQLESVVDSMDYPTIFAATLHFRQEWYEKLKKEVSARYSGKTVPVFYVRNA